MSDATSAPPYGFTTADLQRRWRVGGDKIRALIKRGELIAVNLATSQSSRPQWRITPESVAAFEQRRTSAPPPVTPRRRRRPEQVDFYPD